MKYGNKKSHLRVLNFCYWNLKRERIDWQTWQDSLNRISKTQGIKFDKNHKTIKLLEYNYIAEKDLTSSKPKDTIVFIEY